MFSPSYIELDKAALNSNIAFMKKKAGPGVTYSVVIKGNAYGHGIEDLVPMLEVCGVNHFSVFNVEEARRVQHVKRENCHVMIMGFVDHNYLDWVIENDISFFVFTPERLQKSIEVAQKLGKAARVHIEVETGMHRTGFANEEIPQVIDALKRHPQALFFEGLCTHLAGAESIENFPRIEKQIQVFDKYLWHFQSLGLNPRYQHLACSAGVLNFPYSVRNLIRIGISSYGFWPNNETKLLHMKRSQLEQDPLKRILSWKSKVMSVNRVGEGEYVSYGTSYLTNRESVIATVPVGYSYGFSRTLSNRGHVLVGGKRVPVIGTVNMNMMVLDVTDVEGIAVDDEVVLIGQQGERSISVNSFSDMNNSMNYELLTRLPVDIPRYQIG